jgi:hypothetical protein
LEREEIDLTRRRGDAEEDAEKRERRKAGRIHALAREARGVSGEGGEKPDPERIV